MEQHLSSIKVKSTGLKLLACVSLFGLTACQTPSASDSTSTQLTTHSSNEGIESTRSDEITARITFNQSDMTIEGSHVTQTGQGVEITAGGTYYFKGDLADGQIVVNSPDEENVYLVLDGVNLYSSTSAPIYIQQAKNAIIVLEDGSVNTITDASEYVLEDSSSDEPNAAIFSKDDLKIKGSGTLTVNANYHHGIVSKDDLVIKDGVINVNAVADGLKGKDSVTIEGGNLVIEAGGDGIQSHNATDLDKGYVTIEGGEVSITATLDGIQAETNLTINDGTLNIQTGGGSENASSKSESNWGMWGNWNPAANTSTSDEDETSSSAKGLKAGNTMTLNGGTVTIDSSDDSIHSNDLITINGGTYTASSGDDGVHADTTLEINGGTVNLLKSYEGLESTTIIINDGTLYVTASDDGINAAGGNDQSSLNGRPGQNQFSASNGAIEINGGYLYVDAMGDGLDANGSIILSDGLVIVNGPTDSGNGALDFDSTFNIYGGTLIAVGNAGMAQTPSSSSTQPILNIRTTTVDANTLMNITDSNGTSILTFTPAKAAQSFIISTPDLQLNETYTISTGGESTGVSQDGLYTGGTYSNGTELGSLTLSSIITSLGQTGGMMDQMPGGHMEKPMMEDQQGQKPTSPNPLMP